MILFTIENMTEKQLTIRLIRDSLINLKLVSGLNDLGLHADNYTSFLSDTIFLLMGFQDHPQSDLIFENVFLKNAEKVKSIDFSFSKVKLDKLSEEIYEELVFAKESL